MHEHVKIGRRRFLGAVLSLAALSSDVFGAASRPRTTRTCVTNGAGGSTLTSALSATLTPRLAWQIQNTGPNPIWCAVNNVTPTAGSSTGSYRLAQYETWNMTVTQSNSDTTGKVIKCIAETAAQASPACTNLNEAF